MIFCVCVCSVHPRQHVIHVEGERAAQIVARLLGERFPGTAFTVYPGPDFTRSDCHPSIRDSALSVEVQHLVAAELVIEAAANPDGLPKWLAFQYRDGGVSAYLEHDLPVVTRCRRDPETIQERAIYAHRPGTDAVLDCFRTDDDAA